MVGGLFRTFQDRVLDSTEVLRQGSSKWMKVGSLPFGLTDLKAVNIQNTILSFGEKIIWNFNDVM